MASAFLVSLFKVVPSIDGVREVVYFGKFRWRQDVSAVVQTLSSFVGHTKQPVLAIVPNLVLFQLHGQPPELLIQSLRSRNVAILGPSRSSLQSHVGDLSRRSAVSCFLHSSSPVSCTTPTKSLAKYDQVLQLGPFFFPNRSGIKLFGSTNRMRDLV